nr:MAG TPA: hypothetical protein [Caudoviricetes sp.]
MVINIPKKNKNSLEVSKIDFRKQALIFKARSSMI